LAAYVLKRTTDEQNRLRFLEGDKADDKVLYLVSRCFVSRPTFILLRRIPREVWPCDNMYRVCYAMNKPSPSPLVVFLLFHISSMGIVRQHVTSQTNVIVFF
jgi:hypothetical protein